MTFGRSLRRLEAAGRGRSRRGVRLSRRDADRELVARGMDPAGPRGGRRRFGDIDQVNAACRALGRQRDNDMRRTEYLAELTQDVTFALRQLLKNPGFTAVAVLTLALGIGGTTAIFSAVYAVVLQPLPLRDPARLVVVSESTRVCRRRCRPATTPMPRPACPPSRDMSAKRFSSFNLSDGTTPERIIGARVTANYFDVMGVAAAAGAGVHRRGRPAGQRTRGRPEPSAVDAPVRRQPLDGRRTTRVNGVSYTVAGVMPPSFDLTTDSEELWTPIAFTPAQKAPA